MNLIRWEYSQQRKQKCRTCDCDELDRGSRLQLFQAEQHCSKHRVIPRCFNNGKLRLSTRCTRWLKVESQQLATRRVLDEYSAGRHVNERSLYQAIVYKRIGRVTQRCAVLINLLKVISNKTTSQNH